VVSVVYTAAAAAVLQCGSSHANTVCISVCKYLRLLRGKVDIALQSIKQTSYKGTIDWEHNAPTNLATEVNTYKNMNFF